MSQTYECILNNHQKKNDEKEEKKEEVPFKEEIQISEKGIQTGDSLIKEN